MGVALRQTNGIVDTVTGASGGGWYKVYNFAGTSSPNTNFDDVVYNNGTDGSEGGYIVMYVLVGETTTNGITFN